MRGFFFGMSKRYLLLLITTALYFSSCQNAPENKQTEHSRPKTKHIVVAPKPKAIPDSVCIAAVGDIMLGTSYPDSRTLPADSAKNSFKNVLVELHNADITFGNLEGTLLDTGAPAYFKLHQLQPAFLFRMPVNYGNVLKQAGFNVLSLANNHSNDFDERGRKSTMKVLDSLGIQYGGLNSKPSAIFKINGITYGFCAFAPNGQTLPLLNLKKSAEIIQHLKQQCDIVIVSFHGGGEGTAYEHIPCTYEKFITENRGDVHAFAHNAIDAGADIILGNGPHVCRAMELYKNRLIAYSLGNFCTYRCVSVAGICGMAPVLKVYLNKKGEFLNGWILSNIQSHYNGLTPDSLNQAASRIKMLTTTDFEQPGLSISDDGRISRVKY
ncbi:CapA family protein [Mucilaginibacter sp.]|uniref:CapA family protein n=1 Tax=Mucilaginibacter sp. TaxID=1882438 RepID=UPI002848E3C2|nr:CapA family protein [Mucilaginibacter sp.]MDR3696955.1 CapA family protein [Mucilaginibacter sp.]